MSKFCNHCGAGIPEDKKFCTECGMAAANIGENSKAAQTAHAQTPPPAYQHQQVLSGEFVPEKGSKYAPITTGGYIGISLLMCIPIVGLILMIIWAFGGCKKINKRNFARASLIMMAIGLVLSLIVGIASKTLINNALESGGIPLDVITDLTEDGETTNSDIEELQELGNLLDSLNALGSEDSAATEGADHSEDALNNLIEEAIDINQQAEEANDGWPESLRAYPGGTATATASYRTEISDTTKEEMMDWIEELKKDGFAYEDFYDFGISEEDMLAYNGWWATDGNIYLGVSYSEGTVIVDHTKELPDLSSLFE